ncbi:MAG: 3'-5' exonuclease [Flavobacteriales bacterium]|jgi:DNA polymerase-3 subunit epsilon|uniref:3'-5' exonuclease n=1 Tax=Candidatus Ulvibacter alkanivorans TaxID=2267620 RepID=UPI000DF18DED|nr:3'-5' exonuclease [Candidatus Ulvibacter alkanivorans]MCH2490986.1 3'-5' exonuclease [Flavobacteriales bacterium]
MQLNLSRPICFFDLETTGTNVATDRIVEIAILKVYPNGNKESYTWRVNPEIPIPKQSSDIHGITDEMVANEPTFKELAPKVYALMKDCDLGGYNSNRFDIPLLAEALLRAEIDFDMKKALSVDVQTIFHKKEKRTLEAAYKFYCDKELKNAHSAEADTNATYEVLKSQLDRYDDLENDINFLAAFSAHKNFADLAGYIGYNKEGQEIFSFGKHRGKLVETVMEQEPGYFGWLLNADFPLYTKKVLTRIKLRKLNNKLN